ncbi:hypothetical protein H0H87_007804 [Tephrocybe sp. NHM501043]|nr:hypothetical protein H0H87_007804 [Tephrocybe sp. NHM501043]
MAPSREAPESTVQVPSTSTFSFKAPFPASSSTFAVPSPLKQRRVSLALPSSPRVVQAWNFRDDTGLDAHVLETDGMTPAKRGKMRKLANGAESEPYQEKKQRKKWSDEETQMLVQGCNRHGVGNWKTILSDPTLQFDNRFRTYFPDAYKEHYPNARTHLSSKVRSTLPDGSSLFEKTRSKKRRPFTEEEDRALKAGYEKHGTVWATIVKDPVFREQGRRSTDLRDRFRNAFPELYQAAGYKPRNASRKRLLNDEQALPARAATDDQLSMSTTGPVRSRRRAHTSQGLFRGGTKSVPQSTACSEDDDSSAGEEDGDSIFKTPHTPVFVDNVSTSSSRSKKLRPFTRESFSTPATDDDDMDMVTFDQLSSDPLSIPDFISPPYHRSQYSNNDMDSQSQTWSSGVNTPTHSHHAWSTAAGSPTSSHLSADLLMSGTSSLAQSPALQRGMIGKSAWGTQDWFSANPRLDPGHSTNSSYPADGPLSPASPFSFSNLNHGVLDRYDLVPSLMPHDFSSEVGVGDTHSTFSDEMFPPNGFRGFTHHSSYAGDLIFGARAHQPQHAHHPSYAGYAGGAGVGGNGASFGAYGTPGLGLSGISQSTGIHPMQLALPGIDEIGLTSITLDDSSQDDTNMAQDHPASGPADLKMDAQSLTDSGVGGIKDDGGEKFSLDDLVDLSAHDQDDDAEPHATPPGTPHIQRSRGTVAGIRRASESMFVNFPGSTNARSISVPPSDARSQQAPVSPQQLSSSPTSPFQTSLRPGIYFGQQDAHTPSPSPVDQNTNKSLLSSPMPPPPPPPAYLITPLPQDTYTWRPMSPSEMNNMHLSFLDLHYYGNGGDTDDGGNAEAQMQVRQGQALDLAQASVGGSRTVPVGMRQHGHNNPPPPPPPAGNGSVCRSPNVNGDRSVVHGPGPGLGSGKNPFGGGGPLSGNGGMTGGGGLARSQSHHRGQSAICPQDLVLRSDNKRKRASWDGAHS